MRAEGGGAPDAEAVRVEACRVQAEAAGASLDGAGQHRPSVTLGLPVVF